MTNGLASQCGSAGCVSHLVTDQTPSRDNRLNNTLTNTGCLHEVCWLRLVQGFSGRHQRTCFVFLRQKSAEAYMMDPRDTPGYRLHRALSNLNSIDIEQLDSPDRESESLRPRRFWNK